MTISLLFVDTVAPLTTGGSTQTVTVPFSGVTGTNCLAVVIGSGRSTAGTFTTSATFDGNAMTLEAEASGALGGFGKGSASVFWYSAGNLSTASGDAVFTLSGTNGIAGRIATLLIFDNVQQISPVRDSDTDVFVSSASSSSLTVTTVSSDLVVDALTLGTYTSSLTVNAGQAERANEDNGGYAGDTLRHGSSTEIAIGALTTVGWSFLSSYAHAAVSFIEDAAPGSPDITQVTPASGPGGVVRPSDTNITVDGTDFDPGGNPTQLILSPTTSPNDVAAEIQVISGVTNSTLNWDSVTLGAMMVGPLFLFVRVDPGGGGEDDSIPFPVIVSDPDVHWGQGKHVTTGATGPTTVVSGLSFKPVAAIMQLTASTALDTIEDGVQLGQCMVDESTSMGIGLAAQASPFVVKRQQVSGTGSLFIMSEVSDAASDIVVGTPTLTNDGLDIDFTVNTSGVTIAIVFIGGLTVRSQLTEVQISDNSVTGLPFAPDLLIGISSNQTQGATTDTTFARQSFGMATGSGLGQFNQSTDMDSATARNTEILHGTFLAQLSATTNTWTMVITALTADGYTWTGSNSDSAYVLSLNLDTAQTFLTQYASTKAIDGESEDWPDSGIDNPGILLATVSGRITQGPTIPLGGRWSIGACFPGEDQSGSSVMFIPDTGIGTTQQYRSETNMLNSSSVGGDITLETTVTAFKRAPTVQYVDNPEIGILYNIFMAEEVGAVDDDGVFTNVW